MIYKAVGRLARFAARLPCLWFVVLPPIPPTPFPGGEGGDFFVFLCKGLRPLHPRHLTACGTYSPCHCGTRRGGLPPAALARPANPAFDRGLPSASPVRRKTDRTAILLAVPAAKERGDRGRGTSAFEMVLSPGAGRTSAARGQAPLPPAGHHSGRVCKCRRRFSPGGAGNPRHNPPSPLFSPRRLTKRRHTCIM